MKGSSGSGPRSRPAGQRWLSQVERKRQCQVTALTVHSADGAHGASDRRHRGRRRGDRARQTKWRRREQEARASIHSVRALSGAIEPNVLLKAVDAIAALKEHDADLIERVIDLEDMAFTRGGPDLLVGAYRSVPELLSILIRQTKQPARLVGLIRRAHDEDLTAIVGQPTFAGGDPRDSLSRREREVYELLIQRLTNREIANLLFIEESTVKAHVHHIYDKLGVRSRVALTVQAQLERASGDFSDRGDC